MVEKKAKDGDRGRYSESYTLIEVKEDIVGKTIEGIEFSGDSSIVVFKFTDRTYCYIEGSSGEIDYPEAELSIWQKNDFGLIPKEEYEAKYMKEQAARREANGRALLKQLQEKYGENIDG